MLSQAFSKADTDLLMHTRVQTHHRHLELVRRSFRLQQVIIRCLVPALKYYRTRVLIHVQPLFTFIRSSLLLQFLGTCTNVKFSTRDVKLSKGSEIRDEAQCFVLKVRSTCTYIIYTVSSVNTLDIRCLITFFNDPYLTCLIRKTLTLTQGTRFWSSWTAKFVFDTKKRNIRKISNMNTYMHLTLKVNISD